MPGFENMLIVPVREVGAKIRCLLDEERIRSTTSLKSIRRMIHRYNFCMLLSNKALWHLYPTAARYHTTGWFQLSLEDPDFEGQMARPCQVCRSRALREPNRFGKDPIHAGSIDSSPEILLHDYQGSLVRYCN